MYVHYKSSCYMLLIIYNVVVPYILYILYLKEFSCELIEIVDGRLVCLAAIKMAEVLLCS